MKTLLTWLRYTLARARYHMAAADLDFMEANSPRAIAQQRDHVLSLQARMDALQLRLIGIIPTDSDDTPTPRAEDVRARVERSAKGGLL